MNYRPPLTTERQKLNWLILNQEVWRGFPRPGMGAPELFALMQKHGFYSQSTQWTGVNLHRLVSRVRRWRRQRKLELPEGAHWERDLAETREGAEGRG